MNVPTRKPPRLAEKILGLLRSDRGDYTHLGDFEEIYDEIRGRRGAWAAGFWYLGQTFKSVPGFLAARFYWSAVMVRNYGLVSFRNMIRDKAVTLIALLSLAAGMACFLLVAGYVRFETSYDRFHAKADRIFRVIQNIPGAGRTPWTPDLLGPTIARNVPGVVRVARYLPSFQGKAILQTGETSFFQEGYFADAPFLEVFSFPAKRGDPKTALATPGQIVLTESTAALLFGREDPLGRTVVLKNKAVRFELIVSAVLRDVPSNSHLRFDFLASLDTMRSVKDQSYMFNNWSDSNFVTYVECDPGLSRETARANFEAGLKGKTVSLAGTNLETHGTSGGGEKSRDPNSPDFSLQPLADIRLRSAFDGEMASVGDLGAVRLFPAVAFLILLIACVNYMNLATARSLTRFREIGIRKTTGADRGDLVRQFLGESFFLALAAGLIALGLVALVLPWFNGLAVSKVRLTLTGNGEWPTLFALTVIFVAVASGLYPAMALSSLPPVSTLRGQASPGRRKMGPRNVLVIVQFTASVVLIAATAVVFRQMNHIRTKDLGYDREGVVVIAAREQETLKKRGVLKAEFERLPEVAHVSVCDSPPTQIEAHAFGVQARRDSGEKVDLDFAFVYGDENYLDVFKIELIDGRKLAPGDEKIGGIVVNESLVREMGWTNPLGQTVTMWGTTVRTVVGVVRDFHFNSLRQKIGPMALIYGGGPSLAVRLRPGNAARAVAALKDVFAKTTRSRPFEVLFMDDAFEALYRKEIRAGRIFFVFAALAVLLAALGLLGLTAFAAARRSREIGIRKILGASTPKIVLLLNGDFLRLVAIANLLAWPLAYVGLTRWLQGFAVRVSVGPGILLLSSTLALALAAAVVAGVTIRAARANPAATLRRE